MDDTTRKMYELVREVRHDLNGPLTSALGNIQMLLDEGTAVDSNTRASLQEVEADLRRLAALVLRLADIRPPAESA